MGYTHKVSQEEWKNLGEAVLVWSGWGETSYPVRDERLVLLHFGSTIGNQLLPLLRALVDDFYSSDARLRALNLVEMARLSEDEFARKHPCLSRESVRALAWCYTFDYK